MVEGNGNSLLLQDISEQPAMLIQLADEPVANRRRLSEIIFSSDRIWLTGCGSAYRAALLGSYLLSQGGRRRGRALYAPELVYFSKAVELDHLVLALSRSGETDTLLEAMREFHSPSVQKVALVNTPDSSLSRMMDETVHICAGVERSIVATKTYLAMCAYLLAVSVEEGGRLVRTLESASRAISKVLDQQRDAIQGMAAAFKDAQRLFVFGSGSYYPMALEAALKLKEISNLHAEGFACGELSHSTAAILESGTPCVVFVPGAGRERAQALECVEKITAYGGRVIGVSASSHPSFNQYLHVPADGNAFLLASIVPLQLLAYCLAEERGINLGSPRNIRRVVTKEAPGGAKQGTEKPYSQDGETLRP